MRKATIKFGIGNSLTRDFPDGTTFGQILADREIKAVLGIGDNVKAVVGGVDQPNEAPVGHDDVISVETKIGTKGS